MKTKENLTAVIWEVGLFGVDKPEKIEKKRFNDLPDLKNRLKELQKGHTVEGKIQITKKEVSIRSEKRVAFESFSDTDYGYLAIICGEKGVIKN